MDEQQPDDKRIDLNLKIMKLSNGDIILGDLRDEIDSEVFLYMGNPIRLLEMFDAGAQKAVYAMMQWLPFSSQEIIAINKLAIVTLSDVKADISMLYLKRLALQKDESLMEIDTATPDDEIPEMVPPAKHWIN
jgi:hypothetical protein